MKPSLGGASLPWRQESVYGEDPVHVWETIEAFLHAENKPDGMQVIQSAHGGPLEFLTSGRPFEQHSGPVMVVYSGAVTRRSERTPPFPSGRSLAPGLDVPLIAISDPSLALAEDLSISWYAGSATQDVQRAVEEVLRPLAECLDGDLWLVGGSAGGFAALETGHRLGQACSVFVWNPQTIITEYFERYVKQYAIAAFPPLEQASFSHAWKRQIDTAMRTSSRRSDLMTGILPSQSPRRLLYLQATGDWHLQAHCAPYMTAHDYRRHSPGIWTRGANQVIWLAETGQGHTPPDGTKIHTILKTLFEDKSTDIHDRILYLDSVPLFQSRRLAGRPEDLRSVRNQVASLTSWRLRHNTVQGFIRHLPDDYARMRWSAQLLGDSDRVLSSTKEQMFPSEWKFTKNPHARRIRVNLHDGFGNLIVRRYLMIK